MCLATDTQKRSGTQKRKKRTSSTVIPRLDFDAPLASYDS